MSEVMDEITTLTKEWFNLIVSDHHKDRDCHWYINTVWSYGDRPYYRIEHYGYCYEDVDERFLTYGEALFRLKEILIKATEEEKNAQLNRVEW